MEKKARKTARQIKELFKEVRSVIEEARGDGELEPYEVGIINGIAAAGAIADGDAERAGVDMHALANNVLCMTRLEAPGADLAPIELLMAFERGGGR